MPKKIQITTKEYITNAPLPVQTDTYTVISHDFIIKEAHRLFAANNLEVEKEVYTCSVNADVARGIFHLKSTTDSELGMSFTWVNSYNKSTKFRCSVAGNILISGAMMMAHDTGSYIRKHTGTADTDVLESMEEQINNTSKYFNNLIKVKEVMKQITVNEKRRAEIIGLMYIYNQILTSDQLGVVKKELSKPSFDYKVDTSSLWFMYCSIAHAIKQAHPKTWMDQHSMLYLICHNEFEAEFQKILSPIPVLDETTEDIVEESSSPIPPGQLTIFDMIEKVEEDEPQSEDMMAPSEECISEELPVEVIEEGEPVPIEEVVVMEDPMSNAPEVPKTALEILTDIAGNIPLTDLLKTPSSTEATTEAVGEEIIEGWLCLGCDTPQSFEEVMYEGQLCKNCHEKL